jgi:hypothetical protein
MPPPVLLLVTHARAWSKRSRERSAPQTHPSCVKTDRESVTAASEAQCSQVGWAYPPGKAETPQVHPINTRRPTDAPAHNIDDSITKHRPPPRTQEMAGKKRDQSAQGSASSDVETHEAKRTPPKNNSFKGKPPPHAHARARTKGTKRSLQNIAPSQTAATASQTSTEQEEKQRMHTERQRRQGEEAQEIDLCTLNGSATNEEEIKRKKKNTKETAEEPINHNMTQEPTTHSATHTPTTSCKGTQNVAITRENEPYT